jgi:hypothetical protein
LEWRQLKSNSRSEYAANANRIKDCMTWAHVRHAEVREVRAVLSTEDLERDP